MSIPRKCLSAFFFAIPIPTMVFLSVCVVFSAAAPVIAIGQAASVQPGSNPPKLSNGSGAYATDKYANLFAEAGYSQKDTSAKIQTAFRQLFHGDPATQSIYFETGKNANGPLAYVTDWNNHDVRTEGMSYGMMIAVQLGEKAEFDALWNWAKTYMYISDPKHPSYGFFSWSCKSDGTPNEETAAPDGEEYFVMALYFAANRWGNGTGIYDYKKQADELLTAMRHRKQMSGPTKFGPRTVAAEVNERWKMIRFVPIPSPNDFTDPSYHLPAFYELWARWGPKEDRQFWADAAEVSRAFFVKTTNPQTGLAPGYANFDGTPRASKFPESTLFNYDSWRTASNWSVDWSWWRKDRQEPVLSDRIQAFFESQGMDKYGDLYTLEGKEVKPGHSTGLVATNAVASLAATDPRKKKFLKALWDAPVPSGQMRYYDGMLYMMSLMHLSGEYRIIKPH